MFQNIIVKTVHSSFSYRRRPSPLYDLFYSITPATTPLEFDSQVAHLQNFDPCEIPCDAGLGDRWPDIYREDDPIEEVDSDDDSRQESLISIIIRQRNVALLRHLLDTYGEHLSRLHCCRGSPLWICFLQHAVPSLRIEMAELLCSPETVRDLSPESEKTILTEVTFDEEFSEATDFEFWSLLVSRGAKLHPVPAFLKEAFLDAKACKASLPQLMVCIPSVLAHLVADYSTSWWSHLFLLDEHICQKGCLETYVYPRHMEEERIGLLTRLMKQHFSLHDEDLALPRTVQTSKGIKRKFR